MSRLIRAACAIALAIFISSVGASGQAKADVAPGEAFSIAWEHAGESGTLFRLRVNGLIVKNWTNAELVRSAGPVGVVTFTAPVAGLPAGTHALDVRALNAFGESAPITLAVIVGAAPAPVKGLRIITVTETDLTVAPDGTVLSSVTTSRTTVLEPAAQRRE